MIDLGDFADDRGLKVAAKARKLMIPSALQFTPERLMKSACSTHTDD